MRVAHHELDLALQQHGLAALDVAALRHEADVRALFRREIDRVNRDQKGYERIRAFRLLLRSFGEEDGLVTPSMKLRRHKVAERFRAELDSLFAEVAAAQPLSERDRLSL